MRRSRHDRWRSTAQSRIPPFWSLAGVTIAAAGCSVSSAPSPAVSVQANRGSDAARHLSADAGAAHRGSRADAGTFDAGPGRAKDAVASGTGSVTGDVGSDTGDAGSDTGDAGPDPGDAGSGPADAGADSGEPAQPDVDAGADSAQDSASDAGADAGDAGNNGSQGMTDPAEPGPLGTTASKQTFVHKGTSVAVNIHTPATKAARPLLIFLHGFGLPATQYASYGAHLASHGWTVLTPQLPGSVFAPTSHAKLAVIVRALLDHALGAKQPFGALKSGQIALAGHSMGGKIAMLVAAKDARVRAVFGVDPVDAAPPFGANPVDYPSVTPELMPAIKVPVAALGETVNATAGLGGQACAPKNENFEQYYAHAVGPALSVEVVGAGHMAFLDKPDCGLMCMACPAGSTKGGPARKLARRYLTAFVCHAVLAEPGCKAWLTGVHATKDVQQGLVKIAAKNGL